VSEQNLALARRMFDAFAARDVEAAIEVSADDVEFLPVTANLTTGGVPYRGHEGIARYFADVGDVWSDVRLYPDELRDLGDCVLVLGRVHARGGGMIIDQPTGWLWRFRGGKISWGRVYGSHEEALEAAAGKG
jgi:ketosteroid isomerase-like protein